MTDKNTKYIGVDVAKKNLVISLTNQTKTLTIANTQQGHKQFIKTLRSQSDNYCVVVEATGGYEAAFVDALVHANIEAAVVHPALVRAFAKSQSIKAKTDPIDASMIRQFAEVSNPRRFSKKDQSVQQLRALLDHRSHLLEDHNRYTNRLETASQYVVKEIKQMLRNLDKQISKIEEKLKAFCESNEPIRTAQEKLEKVKGIGPVLSRSLIAYLPEAGTLNDREVASLVGLAPYNRDSGSTQRRMRIYAGRGKLRPILFMAAMVASRHNPILKRFYEHLISKHKPRKVALTAVMRKLVVLANKILKNDKLILAN